MDPRIDELRTLLRDEPGSRRFFQLGELLRKENDLGGAEDVLRQGLDHHPRYVAAWVSLGRIQLAKTELGGAERSFARALELDPENAVAARLIGETAEMNREWVRAVKAFKLARALSPHDPDLDVKIAQMELRIAGEPFDDELPMVPISSVSIGSDVTSSDEITQVFDLPDSDPTFFTEPKDVNSSSREVFAFSDDDPFAVTPSGGNRGFSFGDDVFAVPETEVEGYSQIDVVVDDPSGPPVLSEPEPEPEDAGEVDLMPIGGDVAEPLDEGTACPEEMSEAGEDILEHELPEPFVDEIEGRPVEGFEDDEGAFAPSEAEKIETLPTLTLARLAIDQGESAMAEKILMALLEKNPRDSEARLLLAALVSAGGLPQKVDEGSEDVEVRTGGAGRPGGPSLKILALQGWMKSIRSASGRSLP